jgi:hypothetical protein
MDEVNEASILHNLRTRFSNELIYTSVGDILVAINPFQWLNLYSDEHVRQYHSGTFSSARPPPHVFHVASEAYRHMTETKKDQTILISGESGAGKTECTKQCVTYLSSVAGHGSKVAERILAANPLLEAFGNAKTSRNDNSSRFGKFMQIIFDDQRYQVSNTPLVAAARVTPSHYHHLDLWVRDSKVPPGEVADRELLLGRTELPLLLPAMCRVRERPPAGDHGRILWEQGGRPWGEQRARRT